MTIAVGPITQACPGWGLDEGSVTSLVKGDERGRPGVLAAQIICGAALANRRVAMLLPESRMDDEAWLAMVSMFTDSDAKSAAVALSELPITMAQRGTGRTGSVRADLVYAPGLSTPDLRRLEAQTNASILVVNTTLDHESTSRSFTVIRVGGDALAVDAEGIEIPVAYDPGGPMYTTRPA